MTQWTEKMVANRFEEAMETMKRLPSERVQGYISSWPEIKLSEWELEGAEPPKRTRCRPTPKQIDEMNETMEWLFWLEVEERHLVWQRARGWYWDRIGRDIESNPHRSTLWRQWNKAMSKIASELNNNKGLRRCK